MAKRSPRLKFSEEEQQNPKLKKAVRKAEKAADKLDKAEAKIPTQKLSFDEKKIPSKLTHAARDAPADLLTTQFHREMRESDDNSAIRAADTAVGTAETMRHAVRSVSHNRKLQPYRTAVHAEKYADKANLNALQKEIQQNTPNASTYSRWQQKKAIKQEYAAAKSAAAKRNSETTAQASEIAAKAAEKASEQTRKTAEFVREHSKEILLILAVGALLMICMSLISSCSLLFQSALGSLGMSTFGSDTETLQEVEAVYCGMEDDLRYELENYEALHSDYDEYVIVGDVLGHDPYVLAAILSAMYSEFTLDEVRETLEVIFGMQYELTESLEIEIYFGEDSVYEYTICTVELICTPLEDLAEELLTDEQLEMYEIFMETKGNYPDLFAEAAVMSISDTETDTFALMKAEAERFLGYPYVWGGSSPETSFDCSGYVAWVANHSGWSIGRPNAQGLYNLCTPVTSTEVLPGDLVFFKGTYATPGVSHVGIYAGNNEMIHAGDPISYADLTLPYWQRHFFAYGRLPEQH